MPSAFSIVNLYFDFKIINAKEATSNIYKIQNDKTVFRAISGIAGKSVLILSKINSMLYIFFVCFTKLKSGTQMSTFKIKRSPTIQSKILKIHKPRLESGKW